MGRYAGMGLRACFGIGLATVLLTAVVPRPCSAQELEPRRWSHLPIGVNLIGMGYGYTEADISDAPAFRLEDVQLELHTWAAKFIRPFELMGKTARVEVSQGYQEGHWEGLLDGSPASTSRAGWTDTVTRFSVNLYGAPPLGGKDYAAYRASHDVETIAGVALEVALPTGEYNEERLINLGSNRFTFRPQIGVVHQRGDWSMELTGSVWIYGDNDEFFRGNKLEQDPFFTVQGHVTYTFHPGVWVDVAGGYGYGAQSTVNGVEKDDRKENIGFALSVGFPLARDWATKLGYVGMRRQATTGNDSDTFTVAITHAW